MSALGQVMTVLLSGSEKVQELLNVLLQSAVEFPDPAVSCATVNWHVP